MRWFKYCKFLMVCCLVAVFSGCEEDDDYRGYMLSGRWFGNLGMMVDGQPAIVPTWNLFLRTMEVTPKAMVTKRITITAGGVGWKLSSITLLGR